MPARMVHEAWVAAGAVAFITVELFGRLFDRFGFSVLIGLTLLSASFAPLVFLGGFWTAQRWVAGRNQTLKRRALAAYSEALAVAAAGVDASDGPE